MQHFFNNESERGQAVIVPPSWRFIKDGLTRNHSTVKSYYNSRVMAVKSNHLLIRLLTGLGVSFTHQIERYHQIVEAKALQYSMGFKLTSSVYKGSLFKGVFYGENSTEVLVATDEVFNPYDAYANWKELQPVKCVYHNRSDLTMLIPNGKTTGTEEGVSVISINIPMLAVQFKAFVEETYGNFIENNDLLHPAAHFIHMYVLPGMLESQTNIALFNRAYNLLMGRPMTRSLKDHPFYITDFRTEVDKYYAGLIGYFTTHDKDFKSILKTFSCMTGSFDDALRLPETASTRQVAWTDVIARIRAIEFMAGLTLDSGRRKNAVTMNSFLRMFLYYSNDAALRHALPYEYRIDLDRSISNVFKLDYTS